MAALPSTVGNYWFSPLMASVKTLPSSLVWCVMGIHLPDRNTSRPVSHFPGRPSLSSRRRNHASRVVVQGPSYPAIRTNPNSTFDIPTFTSPSPPPTRVPRDRLLRLPRTMLVGAAQHPTSTVSRFVFIARVISFQIQLNNNNNRHQNGESGFWTFWCLVRSLIRRQTQEGWQAWRWRNFLWFYWLNFFFIVYALAGFSGGRRAWRFV